MVPDLLEPDHAELERLGREYWGDGKRGWSDVHPSEREHLIARWRQRQTKNNLPPPSETELFAMTKDYVHSEIATAFADLHTRYVAIAARLSGLEERLGAMFDPNRRSGTRTFRFGLADGRTMTIVNTVE